MVRLQHDDLVLELAPDVGGSISAFYTHRPGQPAEHWLRPAQTSALLNADPLGMASFPLVPWCNRIRLGRAQALGREIVLPPDPWTVHTLHGLGWRGSWRVRDASLTQAQLDFVHTAPAGPGWPWSFQASQVFALQAAGFECRMTLTNLSDAPMPYGLGHHPYFEHLPGTWLQCEVQAMWAADDQRLPTGLVQPDFLPQLARGLVLETLDLDHNFIGWNHAFTVRWPGRQRQAVLRAAPPLDFFVLYCPRGQDHFCAEPVSNCTDWLNLPGRPAHEVGGGVVAPGQSAQACWSLRLEPLG